MAKHKIDCKCHHHTHVHSEDECHNHKAVWWMLLSHHAACDMDRTWLIFGVNVCARCLCIFLGVICAGMGYLFLNVKNNWMVLGVCVLSMIPSGIDFTIGELSDNYPRTNIYRAITGFLFGCGLGVCIAQCLFQRYWLPIMVFCLCAALMQVIISFIFHACGHLEDYLKKYEDAVKR